jgi:gamma-glutamyl hercynylcysteine S-oxide synthase
VSLERLARAWQRSDRLFGMLDDEAWLEQPIALRQPLLFYLGHLPAFAWNHIGRGVLGEGALHPRFDALFERGIDPVGVDAYAPLAAWPERSAVVEYRDRVRERLSSALAAAGLPSEAQAVASMVIEHELMHHETLLYMFQELDHALKRRPADWPRLPDAPSAESQRRDTPRRVEVPPGTVRLGAARGALTFAWDNELPEHRVEVAAFELDERPVTNSDFVEFVGAGGYAERRFWREQDWDWRVRQRIERPHSWRGAAGRDRSRTGPSCVRSLFEDVPFETAADWPVAVSWAEAAAYARWRGARLPTEAEWHRAAVGISDAASGNVDFRQGSPLPVGSEPRGASAWGVHELAGNGWEWTATPFAPFPGFEPLPRYPGYSADFFDGAHFVLLGGSWATDEALLRPSFRNWFQPHYPYVFSKFRCASIPSAGQ